MRLSVPNDPFVSAEGTTTSVLCRQSVEQAAEENN